MSTSVQITFDCADPDSLAHFWADLLGYELDSPPDGYDSWEDWLTEQGVPESEWNSKSAITDPDGDGPLPAPDPKAKELSGLKKVDDLTFTVKLSAPFSGFPATIGYSGFFPVAKACLDDFDACNETSTVVCMHIGSSSKMPSTWRYAP